jgi:catechol 2,3-dioxygenase-like lactoylglutathione lyase family enzyme
MLMFSHIQVGARNLDRMIAFYDSVLTHFGLERRPFEPGGGPDGALSGGRAEIAQGGGDEGQPGLRPHYNADYYGAYCRDPEGNKLCFVHAANLP